MSKLAAFLDAEQLSLDDLFREAEAGSFEPIEDHGGGGDGLSPGDLVTHVDFADFRGKVVEVEDGKAMVKVLGGWRGLRVPPWSVSIPTSRLEVI